MSLSCSCCEDGVPRFVPLLNKVLLEYPDKIHRKRSDIYSDLSRTREYKNRRCRDNQFIKHKVYFYLSNHFTSIRLGKKRKDGDVSYCAPQGIIVDHSKIQNSLEPDV